MRNPTILYTPEGCEQACDEARLWLLARGIPFVEARVQSSADLNAFRAMGFGVGFPALAIGPQRLSGFQPPRWDAAFDQAGFPRESRLPPGWLAPPPHPLSRWSRTPLSPVPMPPPGMPPATTERAWAEQLQGIPPTQPVDRRQRPERER